MRRAAVLALLVSAAPLRGADRVDFGRDVLPILSDFCFQCHGPDEKARKAKLRLDEKDSALAVIVPGKPADSELVTRVSSTDEDVVMPPPRLKRKLTPQQVETLKTWVAQGADWGRHWSFAPVAKATAPKTKHPTANPIDSFVRARLEKEGLSPAPPAEKERLIRRVTLDLTGLPPTPKEIDAFLNDDSPAAYEKVVDRLLASPRFGERMAAEWLDLARYADTHGYQMDRFRPVWPYRDWVISAFNKNLPFDQFVTWQLAGDLLAATPESAGAAEGGSGGKQAKATKDQRLATAFNRLHMQNEEGGVVEEEFRVAYVVDRVTTFGTAFLGMTFECSRCHDHKYDPVTMRDFYSLFAFFQNIDESGQTTYFTTATPVPALLLSTAEQDRRIAGLRAKVLAAELELARLRDEAGPAFEEWTRPKKPESTGLVGSFSFDDWKGSSVPNAANPKQPGAPVESPKAVPGKVGRAAELSGENGFKFPNVGHFTKSDPFTLALWVKAPGPTPRAVLVHHSMAPIDAGSRGYELLLEDGRLALGLHHMWPGNSLKVRAKEPVPVKEWVHVAATYDGSGRAGGVGLFVNGERAEVEVVRDKLTKDITYGGREPDLAVGHRFRDNGFKGGAVDEFRVYSRAITAPEVAELAGAPVPDDWFDFFIATAHAPTVKAAAALRAARRALDDFVTPIPEIMVMEELKEPKPAYILKRGAYDARGERVTPDTPKVLPPFPADAPRNRLGLAKWLTDAENPLLARVTVNRAWQLMFGRGLVETPDNFGAQGARPTHPELLDWLAREFINQKWDYKHLFKLIALSATYQQSSKASPELLQRDPDNLLLARGPARRLTAEMLRDQALFASGLLVEKIGGPSVKPYQPPGLWEEIAMGRPRYDQGKGEDLYRRSLYTFWKRTVPPPSMMTLDAADRSVCAVKRQSTTTPLSALVLLNDPQFVEASRFLGERMLKEGGETVASRVSYGFRLMTSREPTDRERAALVKLFQEQKDTFDQDPASAKKLLGVGEKRSDPALRVSELAAAAVVGNVLVNLDEAGMRR